MPSVTPPVPVDQVLPKIVVGLDTHPCNWSNYLALLLLPWVISCSEGRGGDRRG